MKLDLFKVVEKIPNSYLKNKALDKVLSFAVPFNQGLGIEILEASPHFVEVRSRPRRRRTNHVGGAHACFLALMGEYPAGLCLAQNFSGEEFRMIIGSLKMEYFKQGRGTLTSSASRPGEINPSILEEVWIPMVTEIFNEKEELIARCETNWQLKPWELIKEKD